jgi:hypothetical protein
MNIVGLPTSNMVHFMEPKDYLFSEPSITKLEGSEQGGIYHRSFVGFRIEEWDQDLIQRMDDFFEELHRENLKGNKGYTLLTSLSHYFSYFIEKGNCSYWTSKGMTKANLFEKPTLWPKYIFSKMYFSSRIQKENFNVVYYKSNNNKQSGWIKPFQYFQDEIFKNLEVFSNVKVEVNEETEEAVLLTNKKPFRPFLNLYSN